MTRRPITFLIADDDPEDRMLLQEAFMENRLSNNLQFVEDGEQLMNYLLRKEQYEDTSKFPRPGLILLDLNMPKKDGREALKEIKTHPHLKDIPVIVFTTSKTDEDVVRSYDLGVNSFISKPVTFDSLVTLIRDLRHYWLEIVELPLHHESQV